MKNPSLDAVSYSCAFLEGPACSFVWELWSSRFSPGEEMQLVVCLSVTGHGVRSTFGVCTPRAACLCYSCCEALTRKTRRLQVSLTSLNSVHKTRIPEEVPGWSYLASRLSWGGKGGESTKNPGSTETWSLAPSFHWIVLVVQDSLPHPVSPDACLLCQAECFSFQKEIETVGEGKE